jgi:hypothetical protein
VFSETVCTVEVRSAFIAKKSDVSHNPSSSGDLTRLVKQSVDGVDEFHGVWQLGMQIKCVGVFPHGMNEKQLRIAE